MRLSIVSFVLALVATLLVSCGGPKATTPPPTYSAETISQLQTVLTPVKTARERMSELSNYIQAQDWTNTKTFIHGPLGQLRQDISYISRNLLPSDQKTAKPISKDLFFHIEQIDAAAKEENYDLAAAQFREALDDFDAFLDLVPNNEQSTVNNEQMS